MSSSGKSRMKVSWLMSLPSRIRKTLKKAFESLVVKLMMSVLDWFGSLIFWRSIIDSTVRILSRMRAASSNFFSEAAFCIFSCRRCKTSSVFPSRKLTTWSIISLYSSGVGMPMQGAMQRLMW